MSKILIITEKPSVGADIARVLSINFQSQKNGYIEGDKFIISWFIGHVVCICEPGEMDDKWVSWSLDTLPIIPDNFKLKPIKNTQSQFNIVKKLMNSKEVDSIIVATDAAREGQLIWAYAATLAGCNKPAKRLWISSMTDKSIKDGLNNLKPNEDYYNLYLSARCRSESDYLIGLNATRAFTTKYKPKLDGNKEVLSIGRVQTPTLALIVNRQREIDNFKPQSFWLIRNHYTDFIGLWFDKETNENRIFDKTKALALINKIQGKTANVQAVKSEDKKDYHPYLYDLTELQRDGNKKYGFTAKDVLITTQSLYETHKIVTYPRTDSQHLNSDVVSTLRQRISAVSVVPYTNVCEAILKMPNLPVSKRYVDDSKVSDHHAIIPTEKVPDISKLSDKEKKIYDLIVRRFLSVFLPPHEYQITTIITSIENELFSSKGKVILKQGWKILYKNDSVDEDDNKGKEDDSQSLPETNVGENIKVVDTELKHDATKPPAVHNEASLLDIMKHAGRLIEDEELKAQLKEGGLGTPATRDSIIEKLIKVGYIERKGKKLLPTPKGAWLIDIVPTELKSAELTAKWEKALNLMAKGKMTPARFMDSIKKYSTFIVNEAKKVQLDQVQGFEKTVKEIKTVGKCKECSAEVVETSKGWSCSEWRTGCKFGIRKDHPYLAAFGKKVTATMVKALLKSDKITIKLTDKKNGTETEKNMYLLKEGQYWNIKFEGTSNNTSDKKIQSIASNKTYQCPSCKKGTLAMAQSDRFTGWGCDRWKEGCKFSIPASKCGIQLEPYIDQLVANGKTEVISNFVSGKGNKFPAKLIVNGSKLEMEFIKNNK